MTAWGAALSESVAPEGLLRYAVENERDGEADISLVEVRKDRTWTECARHDPAG